MSSPRQRDSFGNLLEIQPDYRIWQMGMTKKKVFALRLDEDVYAAVERWAADEFLSTNGQLEWIISML